ncbi:PREDICTED: titin-like [Branchiostoma belcheri]|uniref:Titin-like n=1 Tax=Branchiostoma belcheri TaxID=7741 RepID=A0A6P4ZGT0_BRABE|nr:PREDICTED: titin-like [Branchiostoma belcheri]
MDLKTKNWKKVSGAVRKTTFKIPKLIPFNEYQFCVSAQNIHPRAACPCAGPRDHQGEPEAALVPARERRRLRDRRLPGGEEGEDQRALGAPEQDQPDPPKKVDITEITPITVSLAWVKPDYDGGSRITSYVVEKLRTSVEDAQWERCTVLSLTRCTVTDLVPHEEYRFRVSAQNYGAISEPRETTAVVCKEQIVPASIDLSAVTSDVLILKEGQDFILKLHGMPTPAVTWYKGLGVFRETIRVVTKTVGGVTQLIFRKCEKVDGGTYTVVVANPAGKQTAEIQFRVGLGKDTVNT